MDTKLIHIKENSTEFTAEEDAGLRQAGEIIKNGGLVAFPTETVYGLGGRRPEPRLLPENLRRQGQTLRQPFDSPHLPLRGHP